MTTTGVPENDVLEEAKKVSFANASSLQKANRVLENTLAMIGEPTPERKHEVLSSDGILRTAGTETETKKVLTQVLADPTQTSETGFAALKSTDVNSWIDVMKQSFSRAVPPIKFSAQAQMIVQKFIEDPSNAGTNFNLMKLIDELVAANAYEEAKTIHNNLLLGYLTVKQSDLDKKRNLAPKDRSKMDSVQVAVVLAPRFALLLGQETNLEFNGQILGNIKAILENELNQTDPTLNVFNVSFDKKYPEAAKKLAQEYVKLPMQTPKAPSAIVESTPQPIAKKSASAGVFGLVKAFIATIVNPIKAKWNKFFRNPFSKKKNPQPEISISAPQSPAMNQGNASAVGQQKQSILPESKEHVLLGQELKTKPKQNKRPPTRNRQVVHTESTEIAQDKPAAVSTAAASTPTKTAPPRPPRAITPQAAAREEVMQAQREIQRPVDPSGSVAERRRIFEEKRKAADQNNEGKRPAVVILEPERQQSAILESEKPQEGTVRDLKSKFEKQGVEYNKGKPPTGGKK